MSTLDFYTFFIGIGIVILILYWYLTRNNNYWSKQGINGPKPLLLFGTFLDRFKECLGIIDVQYMKKYGDVYGLFDGTSPVLQIADPLLIKQVLVKEFNRFNNRRELRTEHNILNKTLFFSRSNDWKRARTITSSIFTSGKIKKLYGLVRKCLQEHLDNLEELAQNEESINIMEIHESYTLDVLASCAFATHIKSYKDPNNPFIVNARKFFEFKASRYIPAFVFPKFLNRLFNVKMHFDLKASEWMSNVLKHLIEKRQENKEKRHDFLQLLIDAKVDDSKRGDETDGLESHYFTKDEEDITYEKNSYMDKCLTEEEIIAQCFIFLVAGFETTATALGYMSYSLALKPECQEKLYNEVVTAMGSEKEISYDELHRLPYLDACISETLRLYPPVTRLEREVNQDFKLGDSGIRLYKRQLVEVPVYAIHHSEKYFQDAASFNPERFLPENRNEIIPYTYMPFGTGPRICIGMRFALLGIKLAMSHILMRYRFIKCDKTEEKIRFKPFTPLLSPYSVTVGIEKR